MRHALTVAGSDSGGGAGIQADLKTFAAHGVYGTSAITAITAQNTERVTAMHVVPAAMVGAQIDAVASDIRIDAMKTGMLATAEIVATVSDAIARWRFPHVVVDPVMVAKSGDHLLNPDAVAAVRAALIPHATIVTPNRPEAEVLAGRPVRSQADARDAARAIAALGCGAVLIKGGHFEGETLVNLLFDGRDFHEVLTQRIDTRHTHGTGCSFAAALAARLARGSSLVDAVRHATQYVADAITHATAIGHGHGPIEHFWKRRDSEESEDDGSRDLPT